MERVCVFHEKLTMSTVATPTQTNTRQCSTKFPGTSWFPLTVQLKLLCISRINIFFLLRSFATSSRPISINSLAFGYSGYLDKNLLRKGQHRLCFTTKENKNKKLCNHTQRNWEVIIHLCKNNHFNQKRIQILRSQTWHPWTNFAILRNVTSVTT